MNASIPLLADRPVAPGERWIFSAGFNVADGRSDTSRVDSELDDIASLADRGARVAILSHQGRHRDGTARHLDDIAHYVATRLLRPVHYYPDNASSSALTRSQELSPGEVCLFGNTRHHAGFDFHTPTRIVFGRGRLDELGDCTRLWGRTALIV